MGYKELSETLDRPQGYASISDNSFRSMILHTFLANSSRIQESRGIDQSTPNEGSKCFMGQW